MQSSGVVVACVGGVMASARHQRIMTSVARTVLAVFEHTLDGFRGDGAFVGEGEPFGEFGEWNPGDVDAFLVGVECCGDVAAGGVHEEVVHHFVDSCAVYVEPVVDAAEGVDDFGFDPCFFVDFAAGGFVDGFVAFEVAFGEAPFEFAGAVSSGEDGDEVGVCEGVEDDAACGGFPDGGARRLVAWAGEG